MSDRPVQMRAPIEDALDALMLKDALITVMGLVAICILAWWGASVLNSITNEHEILEPREEVVPEPSPRSNLAGADERSLLRDQRPAA